MATAAIVILTLIGIATCAVTALRLVFGKNVLDPLEEHYEEVGRDD